jgi:hypothetical protein
MNLCPKNKESNLSHIRTFLSLILLFHVVNFIKILRAAFVPIFFAKKIQSHTVIREKLRKALLKEKVRRKMLMKLAYGLLKIIYFKAIFS